MTKTANIHIKTTPELKDKIQKLADKRYQTLGAVFLEALEKAHPELKEQPND